MEDVFALGRLWYADRLDPDWTRQTPAVRQQMFRRVGLSGPHWTLL